LTETTPKVARSGKGDLSPFGIING
ncbi:threonylcarbamoyl-AMP synthase, partial [Betaproteobacteria bacterium PRO5]|nr:threonylcarbamoyl-AMP synthase [Betaproteobacteria bacterium PRO5]